MCSYSHFIVSLSAETSNYIKTSAAVSLFMDIFIFKKWSFVFEKGKTWQKSHLIWTWCPTVCTAAQNTARRSLLEIQARHLLDTMTVWRTIWIMSHQIHTLSSPFENITHFICHMNSSCETRKMWTCLIPPHTSAKHIFKWITFCQPCCQISYTLLMKFLLLFMNKIRWLRFEGHSCAGVLIKQDPASVVLSHCMMLLFYSFI